MVYFKAIKSYQRNKMIRKLLMVTFLATRVSSAQTVTNGSFETGDFTGWQTAGTPTVLGSPPTPVTGNFQALINSTGNEATGIYASTNAVSASVLDTFLNTTLPTNANGDPINGEAIQQTFTVTEACTLTFSYAYQSREAPGDGFDETGYVLNGVFHILADTSTPGQSMANATGFFVWGLPYQTVSITLVPGTYTLGFVTYNTFNMEAPSGLFIDNVILSPLPMTFSQWENHFSFTGAPTDTPENDGVPNLLKYLFDINPTIPMSATDRASLPVIGMASAGNSQYVTLTFRESQIETGITINLQTSPDLQNWTTVNPPTLTQQVGVDPATGDPLIEIGVPANGTNKQFMRLNVTMP